MDINIRKNTDFGKDARPKIREVVVPIGFSKALNWWRAASRWPLILLAGLAPIFFLPLTALPVAANKEILVFTLILAAFFALLGRGLIEGRIRYPGHLLTAALLFLVLVWGAASFFSVNQSGSLIGSWAAPDSFVVILLFVILTFSIVMVFNKRDITISILVFLASLTVLGIFELLQLMKIFVLPFEFSKNAAFNPVGSVNDLGVLLAFGLVIASGLMSASIPRIEESAEGGGKILGIDSVLKKLLGIPVVILLLNLIIIDFWAIWVGLALAMVFLISFLSAGLAKSEFRSSASEVRLQNPPKSDFKTEAGLRDTSDFAPGLQLAYFRKAWLPSIVLLISLLFLFIPSPLARFIQTPVEVSPTFRATLDIGIANLKAGNYLLGSGPNTWGNIYNLYKPSGINQTIFWSTTFSAGASAMASWVGAVGIFGILALLFLMAAFVWTGILAFRSPTSRSPEVGLQDRTYSQTIFVAVIFMFAMWFLYVVNFTTMAFTFWGIGLFLAASRLIPPILGTEEAAAGMVPRIKKEILIFTSTPKTFIFSLLIVALMVGAAVGIYFEATRYVAEIYFGKAIAAGRLGDNEAAVANLNRAVDFWQYDERYYQNLAQAAFFQLNVLLAKKDIPQETLRAQFQNITTNSIALAQQAGKLNPQNPFNAALLGGIYENLIPFTGGAYDFALSSYNKVVSLDPKNPSNYLALGRIYIARADLLVKSQGKTEDVNAELDKATLNLTKAVELKQDYAPARFLLVQIYDRQGKLPEAVSRAEELVMLNNQDVGALFQLGFLYYKSGRYGDSKIVFERTIELSPNYSNARYFLGLIYDRGSLGASKDDFWTAKTKASEQFEKIAELNPDNAEIKQIIANLKAGKAALIGIAPPLPAPQNRAEAPVSEGKAPVQKLQK